MKDKTIGFIGTGYMGSRFVQKLLTAGYTVHVYNRTKEKAEPLAKIGAILEDSVKNLTINSNIIMSSLFNDAAVEEIYFEKDGVIEHIKPDSIIIELSSIKPETSQKIYKKAKKKKSSMLDAAISGSTPALEKGEVLMLIGGDRGIYEKSQPLLELFSKKTFYMGGSGKGETMKLVVNTLLGIEMAGIAESVRLGETLGLERSQVLDVLGNTAVIAPGLKGKLENLKREEYPIQFKTELMQKDLDNILDEAKANNLKMPLSEVADKEYTKTSKQNPEQDFSAIFTVIK